ncbi:hypothetical protein K7I13_08480 [Brucepastera parasyntrophica]|uniref:hypothetical protein n=1 Tax=Brucepastera parasyntrophica TaxID=2880008 RepID=UPI00210A4CC5|nr:hypothetical protein [Brucepastera parasyntrophica]ULQ58602.1 hypothetical protein K7I13_08480 [Brucepastera parasyntrophica]
MWDEQVKEISFFLNTFDEIIKELRINKYEVIIDIAIDKEDILSQDFGLFLFHSSDFLQILKKAKVDYEISIYK